MENLKVLGNKMFWFIICFISSATSFILSYHTMGCLLIIYPTILLFITTLYNFLINPYNKYKIDKTIRNAPNCIGGFVRDENNNPIQGAKVFICDPNSSSNPYLSKCYTITDNIGHYWISNIIDGEWEVTCYKKGYKESNTLKEIKPGKIFIEKITLETL